MVPVQIGKTSGWGLLDTGAQKSVLSPSFAHMAGLTGTTEIGIDAITGVDGLTTSLVVHDLPTATVGAWRYASVKIRVAPPPLFDRLGGKDEPVAVIGMDWIGAKNFAIDYGAQRVWQNVPARTGNR